MCIPPPWRSVSQVAVPLITGNDNCRYKIIEVDSVAITSLSIKPLFMHLFVIIVTISTHPCPFILLPVLLGCTTWANICGIVRANRPDGYQLLLSYIYWAAAAAGVDRVYCAINLAIYSAAKWYRMLNIRIWINFPLRFHQLGWWSSKVDRDGNDETESWRRIITKLERSLQPLFYSERSEDDLQIRWWSY